MDTRTVNVLSICSGYGGIELGLHAALGGRTRTICYVENEISVAAILAARMEDGSLDPAPVWTDLRTFDPGPWRGRVDILAGGFPCQPHSVAGSQLGEDDPRELSGEVLRIAAGLGYPTLFLENVPGILRFYWDSIRPKLRKMGYEVAEGLFTASETGAPHKRERLFILAFPDSSEAGRQARHTYPVRPPEGQTPEPRPDQRGRELADAGCLQRPGQERTVRSFSTGMDDSEHNGLAGPEEPRGVGLRTRHGTTGEVKPEQPTRSGGGTGGDNELAHTEHEGHSQRLRPKTTSQRGRQDLDGSELADADGEGLQGRDECGDSAGERAARTSSPELVGLPLYPPGPNDHDGWAYLLTVMPQVEPTFCRDADGAPAGVDRRLRAIGNGVVPAVGAIAYQALEEHTHKER